jgi:hypothetical protein
MILPNFIKGVFYGLLFFVFVGLMSGSLFDLINFQLASHDTSNWLSTTGKVVDTKIYKHRGRGEHYDVWQVLYAFKASGKERSSNQDTFEAGGGFEFDPGLKPGDSVTVYYSPKDSSQSVLDKAVPLPNYTTLLVSFVFCIGIGIVVEWGGRAFNWKPDKKIINR